MNKVNIKNHLYNIVNNWLDVLINTDGRLYDSDSIDSTLLTYYKQQYIIKLKSSIIVSGGCITSLLLGEEVNDYDIYFKDKTIINSLIDYYINIFNDINKTDWNYSKKFNCIYKFKNESIGLNVESLSFEEFKNKVDIVNAISSRGIIDNKNKYQPICITSNAISLTDKIQIITRFYGEPEEILSNFDYIHTNNYFDYNLKQLVLKQEAIESILTKQLVYVGSKYPICSLIRSRKFINRGWFISAGEYLKMSFQINKLNLFDINILKEQLIGVDAKYFIKFLENLNLYENLNSVDIFALLNDVFEEVGE